MIFQFEWILPICQLKFTASAQKPILMANLFAGAIAAACRMNASTLVET